MDVSAANTPKAAHTRPTGPARPAASVTPNRSNVAGSYSEGVTKTEMAVMLATRMTGVLSSPAPMAASPMMSAATRLTEWPSVWGIRSPASRMISNKINDCLGNPVEIGIAVIWRVTDTAKAVFNVDNYKEYLSLQCDSALRNVVRVYPYDVAPNVDTTGDGVADEGSLRGSSEVVAARIRDEIQKNVAEAGIEVVEARITYLAYAPEIAAVMLQRQQASAIIDARKMIVDGAVGMVEMALDRLSENKVVELDDERKAAMVSNLLVVLCGNRDAQPIVNSGSLY